MAALGVQKAGHCVAKGRLPNPVGAVGGLGQVAADHLVRTLGARLDPSQPVGDGEVDGLVVAGLKVQEAVVLDAPPVAPVQRVVADEVQRAGDVAAVAFAHHQQGALREGFVDQAEEAPGQVGRAPLAGAGVHVEPVEGVPVRLRQVGARHPLDADAVCQGLAPLAP